MLTPPYQREWSVDFPWMMVGLRKGDGDRTFVDKFFFDSDAVAQNYADATYYEATIVYLSDRPVTMKTRVTRAWE